MSAFLTDEEEDALQEALLGSDGEDSNLDSEDEDEFERRLKDALAEDQMSPEERVRFNAMTDAFKIDDLERGEQILDENEENILQQLLREEEQERQKIIDSEHLARRVRLNLLSNSRRAFANANGGKKRTIRKKNRKGTRTRTRQRKNRTRIHKKARKSMKRKTSRHHTFK